MLSVSSLRATACALIVAASLPGCSSPEFERNVAFRIASNLPVIDTEFEGHSVSFVIATALPNSVLGGERARAIGFEPSRWRSRVFFRNLAGTKVAPTVIELPESIPADGLLGADAWRGRTLTLDYRRGLAMLSPPGPIPEGFHSWSFNGPPRISVTLNGIVLPAIVDSAVPDTAIIPEVLLDENAGEGPRRAVDLEIAGVTFDDVDVLTAPTGDIRIGNRLLSRFLVRIDFDHRTVALWPDTR
jgi:hypothetical protein